MHNPWTPTIMGWRPGGGVQGGGDQWGLKRGDICNAFNSQDKFKNKKTEHGKKMSIMQRLGTLSKPIRREFGGCPDIPCSNIHLTY